jgi:branched-chain amino acid transport system permease protein
MFLAVVLGGLGSILGSLLGGLMIGVVQSLSVLVLPLQLHNISVLVGFLVVLSLRPHGLFGRHGRVV